MGSKRSIGDEHKELMRRSLDNVKDAIIEGFTKYMRVLTASLEEHHIRLRPGRASDAAGGPPDQDMNLSPEGRTPTAMQMSERVFAGTSSGERRGVGGRGDGGASRGSTPNQSPRGGRGWRGNSSSSEGRGRSRGGRGGGRRYVPRPAQENINMVDDDWDREVEESERAREGYRRTMSISYASNS